MEQKILLFISLCLITAASARAQTSTEPMGRGTESDPYRIATIENLYWLSQADTAWDAYYEQTAYIDASDTKNWDSGSGFSPIGNETTNFTGHYNGKGYIIDGLTINRSSTDYIGLFGYTSGATIDGLGLTNVNVQGAKYTGGLVGLNYTSSTVSHSYSTGSVSGSGYDVGGLVGLNSASTISHCYSTGSVLGSSDFTGGLVGKNYSATVSNSYSTGKVSGSGSSVGGLVGRNSSSTISNSYSTGLVLGSSSSVGGLVGDNYSSTVIHSYFNSEFSGQTSGIGYDENSQTVKDLTTTAMKLSLYFTDWDFTTTTNWEITNGTSFPRLVKVADAPVILHTLGLLAEVGEEYRDTIQLITMDNEISSLEGLTYPEGMTISNDRILTWTPTATGDYELEIKVTDKSGLSNTYSCIISVVLFEGSGTKNDPYQINSLNNLINLSENTAWWNNYYIQTAHIDAAATDTLNGGSGFSPIGNRVTSFSGNYNGQGYTIDSLTINRPSTNYIGLFGYINDATVDRLGLTNVNVQGKSYVGGLVGTDFSSTISNSYSSGKVSGSDDSVGGLVGESYESEVSDCYFIGSVEGDYNVGGLVGENDYHATVNDSYSTGSVEGRNKVGGLVGRNLYESKVTNSYCTESVVGNDYVGGLVGENDYHTTVSNSYCMGSVEGDHSAGGLVGRNHLHSTVSNSYYNSETSGQASGIGDDDNSQTAAGLTTAEMKLSNSFAGWDFRNTWKIEEDITFPCLANVPNAPVILPTLSLKAKVYETYIDTIQVVPMENQDVSIELLSYPEGMTLIQDSIITWESTSWGNETVKIRVTDSDGLYSDYIYNIYSDVSGSGTASDPYLIATLDNLNWLSQVDTVWNAYFEQIADIDASETGTWNGGNGISLIGNETSNFTGNYNGKGYTIDGLAINRSSTDYIGLFGYTKGATIDSLGLTNVNVQGNNNVGALVGKNSSSEVSNCYSTGSVEGCNNVGGLVGLNSASSTVSKSYSSAFVSGNGDCVGGLVGFNSSSEVSKSYSTSFVSGRDIVGGLVGENYSSSMVSNSYSTGSVLKNGEVLGGLVGKNYCSSTVSNCYYNSEISGQPSGIGYDTNDQSVTNLTTAEMKQNSSFSGWDFTDTWKIEENVTFPRLVNVTNVPVILHTLSLKARVNENYVDTIQVVPMDNQDVSIELLSYPDGMTLTQDSIIRYLPTNWGCDTVVIRVTDGAGFFNSYMCNIQFISLSGSGTKSDPYHICSLGDLQQLSELSILLDKYFIQTANINASQTSSWNAGEGFKPIGNETTKFTGNYNGQGHTIDSLTINRSSTDYVALFGFSKGETIDSLGLTNVNVRGNNSVGGLVGFNCYSTVTNSYSTGSVSGSSNVGGLVGFNSTLSEASHCYSTVSVSGDELVGGLIGKNGCSYFVFSTVDNCYSTGPISGNTHVGGLVGYNVHATVSNCYSTGSVSGSAFIGGLVGGIQQFSTVNNSYSTGLVTGVMNGFGGLVGTNSSSTISNSYYNIETSGQSSGIAYDDNSQIVITGLTTAQMKDSTSFSGLNFTDTWAIRIDSTYPVLLGVSNNAPFAFDDTLTVAGNSSLLTNDYDYESAQNSLTCKLISTSTKGSLTNGVYRFNAGTTVGTRDTITYCVGELLAGGDILWGNYATAILTKTDNTAPVLTSVKEVETYEDTPLTLSLDDVTASDVDGDVLFLVITAGDNYISNGAIITPDAGFVGTLTVPVVVSDGELMSNAMDMTITVGQNVSIVATEQNTTNITVYPNPATTTLNVTGSTAIAYLYNLTGKLLLSHNLSQSNSINLSQLSEGIYLLRVDGECIKVVKE